MDGGYGKYVFFRADPLWNTPPTGTGKFQFARVFLAMNFRKGGANLPRLSQNLGRTSSTSPQLRDSKGKVRELVGTRPSENRF
jgi:hypothetical protein